VSRPAADEDAALDANEGCRSLVDRGEPRRRFHGPLIIAPLLVDARQEE
jgi:hypothetical protein